MFDNISGKIKKLAEIITIIGVIVSVINGFVMMNNSVIAGLLIMAIGALLSWASSFIIYGIGEIIEQLERSNNNTYLIHELLTKLVPEEEKTAKSAPTSVPLSTVEAIQSVAGGWACPKCGTVNGSGAPFCKDCGTYK